MRENQTVIDPASIRQECDASLSRLGVDVLDLYQIHEAPFQFSVPVEESWGTMLELRNEGKVRWCGVSNFDVPLLERCEKVGNVDSLQPPFSLIGRETASELLAWCAAHETGVIAYSPMHSGLLTGSFSADRVRSLPEDDWRRRSPDFVSPQLQHNLALVDALRPIAEKLGVGLGALAIAWVLSFEAVTGAIVGARSAAQVDGWIEASDLVLTDTELDEIAAALQRTGAGSGPSRPAKGGAGPER
jgi:aryl-alcohol dehydrogenase-like predicted oxidoreductase